MPDWYRDHSLSPECYSDAEYLGWAQDNGLYVDAAGNVDYGPPQQPLEPLSFADEDDEDGTWCESCGDPVGDSAARDTEGLPLCGKCAETSDATEGSR